MGKRLWLFLACALVCLGANRPAFAQERLVALVSAVDVDNTLRASLPKYYSGDTLRRELEIALEATGLFTVPTRERRDLDPVIQEVIRLKRGSTRLVGAKYILNPTIVSIALDERRRRAPNMQGKDLVSVTGSVALRVLVLNVSDGSVRTRMSIDIDYVGPSRLADPLENDRLTAQNAVHGEATSRDFVTMAQVVGRAFAKRVLDQVHPVMVAAVAGGKVYLTRGQEAGYRIGEMLRIIRPGAEIRNPVTKELIGTTEEEIGEARISEVQPKMSIADVARSSREIKVGDIVREPVGGAEE